MATILDLIGNTPMAEIKKINPYPNVRIFAKLEGNNPGGSVKDRPAKNMIASAVERGDIKPGMKLIEATSGNTGIALAMIACLYGLEIELVMPSNSTRERTLTMEAFGAKVTLLEGIELCRDYAEEKGASGEFFLLNQFANPDNYLAHYKTTGPEIWKDTEGQITHFVSSMGTTGTIMGCSRYLKEVNPKIQIVGSTHSPYLLGRMEPREVQVTYLRDDGSTACEPLTHHPKFSKWKDEFHPGEMWSLFGEKWVSEPEVAAK